MPGNGFIVDRSPFLKNGTQTSVEVPAADYNEPPLEIISLIPHKTKMKTL